MIPFVPMPSCGRPFRALRPALGDGSAPTPTPRRLPAPRLLPLALCLLHGGVALAACDREDRSDPPVPPPTAPSLGPGRLVVVDTGGRLAVFDLATRGPVPVADADDALVVRGLVRGAGGDAAYLTTDGAVRLLRPGRPNRDDDDATAPAVLLPTVSTGAGVPRVDVRGGVAAAFFPEDGAVHWWTDPRVLPGRDDDDDDAGAPVGSDAERLGLRQPHERGLAIPFGETLLVSHPAGDGEPPSLDLWPRSPLPDGPPPPRPRQRFAGCDGPGAVAETGDGVLAVACRDVVFLFQRGEGDGEVDGAALAVPFLQGDARITGLQADPAGFPLVATYGDSVLLRVTPEEVTRVDLSIDIVDLAFAAPRRLAVLLADGSLLEADPVEGPTGRGVRVAGAPDDPGAAVPVTLTMGRTRLIAAHRETGVVTFIDPATFQTTGRLDLGLQPHQLLAFPPPDHAGR